MSEIKIVFTGSMGAGKSTAIATISEIPVINTDVRATDIETAQRKETTTIAMDYGELTLDDGQKLRLYGTPGQQRFDYMWKILTKGALGLIILIDNAGSDPIGDLARYLDNFHEFITETTAVIGITRTDISNEPSIEAYYAFLQNRSIQLPLFPVDARSKESVVMLIQALVAMLEFG
ncbi:GTP-binding protein [Beggiatoa leptomitoformis]|uniref:GTP-binding protein n=1 Tax=Beggiatoa leptomitoformis TaxID=288004 RepID=A0A2N9Y9X2_9GAMM|nr:ATP/GTP-binding protein [Beggiatoa leptomitoformis]ALG67309.1 GTP-binding protein [Beggiatoa leptomitoformis]AUI67257.1 GTP-binding protein [Beggiatoa leptomitoformis]